MKKIKYIMISLITIFAFSYNVYAASGNLSVSSSSVYVGDNFKVTVSINSVAAWNIHVSASGPVSGCVINQADATADAIDTNKTFSATCTATGTGTITLSLSGDVTSASDGEAVNISDNKSVTVSTKPTPPPANNNNSNNNNNNNSNNTDNRSKNANIKELSVEGYDLIKVDNNNYTLSVSNDVTTVNIKAIAEDSKSNVTGTGDHDINVGENNIEIIVTAENGTQNKITINVVRKDGYYLDDLESLLKNNKTNDINISIDSDTKLTSSDLEKIKNSKKTVNFNCYNEDKSLAYSWIIDGSKLNNISDITTLIKYDFENNKDILRLSNYADGKYVHFDHNGTLPSGIKIRLYVGDKFKDNDIVNVYYHDKQKDTLDLIEQNSKVKDGCIDFYIERVQDYFLTMSIIKAEGETTITSGNKRSMVLPVIIGIISLLVIGVIIVFIIKKKKTNNENNITSNNNSYENSSSSAVVDNKNDISNSNSDLANNYSNQNNYDSLNNNKDSNPSNMN